MYQGKQLYTQTFNEHLEKYCKEIGIESKSSHNIRFTVASVLYQGGVPLTEIQRLLGHTQLSMTLHYLKQILPSLETANLIEKCLA
ncbi:MAG: tyrosine-type recombinase/integrase [Eubacterium ramulus]